MIRLRINPFVHLTIDIKVLQYKFGQMNECGWSNVCLLNFNILIPLK